MRKMGACITRAGNRIETRGGRLRGNRVRATDLRGGAALLVAALGAEGDSVIENTDVIKRGYADVVEKLRSLGAIVEEG
jgi:UDP-N-acetylglucosamine 1-carboxyvinyltransferase